MTLRQRFHQYSVRSRECLILVFVGIGIVGCSQSPAPSTEAPVVESPSKVDVPHPPLIAELLNAIRTADSIELYSLQPGVREGEKLDNYDFQFHGWPLLGKIAITHPQSKEKIVGAMETMLRPPEEAGAPCFTPRHGLRVVQGDTVLETVICFECGWMRIYREKELVDTVYVRGAQPDFDQVLKQHNVSLPDSRTKYYDPTEPPDAPPLTPNAPEPLPLLEFDKT